MQYTAFTLSIFIMYVSVLNTYRNCERNMFSLPIISIYFIIHYRNGSCSAWKKNENLTVQMFDAIVKASILQEGNQCFHNTFLLLFL